MIALEYFFSTTARPVKTILCDVVKVYGQVMRAAIPAGKAGDLFRLLFLQTREWMLRRVPALKGGKAFHSCPNGGSRGLSSREFSMTSRFHTRSEKQLKQTNCVASPKETFPNGLVLGYSSNSAATGIVLEHCQVPYPCWKRLIDL